MPGEFVSIKGTWVPAMKEARMPDETGKRDGQVLLGTDGKPLIIPDPVAVAHLKKYLGIPADEAAPLSKLKMEVSRYESVQRKDSEHRAEITDALKKMSEHMAQNTTQTANALSEALGKLTEVIARLGPLQSEAKEAKLEPKTAETAKVAGQVKG